MHLQEAGGHGHPHWDSTARPEAPLSDQLFKKNIDSVLSHMGKKSEKTWQLLRSLGLFLHDGLAPRRGEERRFQDENSPSACLLGKPGRQKAGETLPCREACGERAWTGVSGGGGGQPFKEERKQVPAWRGR